MRGEEQKKIAYEGTVISVQPRSNVWRYRLDNRTHSHTGYNIFLAGIADGEEREFAVAIFEKQQEKCLHCQSMNGAGAECWIRSVGEASVRPANGLAWPTLQ